MNNKVGKKAVAAIKVYNTERREAFLLLMPKRRIKMVKKHLSLILAVFMITQALCLTASADAIKLHIVHVEAADEDDPEFAL